MSYVFEGLEPKRVWQQFYNINQIPRCSKNEEGARAYIRQFAKSLELEFKEDELGNILIKKSATLGMESRPIVVIQGHMDMVCEKNAGTVHDFSKDPIDMYIEDGWIKGRGTTLGADNAIGLCMGLALLEDDSVAHPALEVLCTIDEETGLTGAVGLKPGFVSGKYLINLDTEEEGHLCIGCAGGIDTTMSQTIIWEAVPAQHKTHSLKIKGLRGGHSGTDIDAQYGNALKLISRVLFNLIQTHTFRIAFINGGSAHNAIPREAEAIIVLDEAAHNELKSILPSLEKAFNDEFKGIEKDISLHLAEIKNAKKVFSEDLTNTAIKFMYSVPHGVMAMSQQIENLVETSTNLAVIDTRSTELFVQTSQRSSVATSITDIAGKVKASGELAGFTVQQQGGYPAWQPDPKSHLLKVCKDLYKKHYNEEPVIEIIHAGLECGIIGETNPGMEMISFGPDITGAHSPDEQARVESTNNVWNFLVEVLKVL